MEAHPPLEQRLTPAMRAALASFNLAALEADPFTVYALTEDCLIGYVNPAWFTFAHRNNGSTVTTKFALGANALLGISGPLRDHYEDLLASARVTGRPVEARYLCPSPHMQRVFLLRVLPLVHGGWLVHNALVVQHAHSDDHHTDFPSYRNPSGFVVQCSSCRRVRHPIEPFRWDWVPSLLYEDRIPISHGLCEPCVGFVFPSRTQPPA